MLRAPGIAIDPPPGFCAAKCFTVVIDGCVMLTTRDNFLYHEMIAHPVLFTMACELDGL